jgi:LmbE family N-acetylglucosaminyl deacetylase
VDLLSDVGRVVAVVARPDDELFGLGALLDRLPGAGADTAVLCFTRGEASSLHGAAGELTRARAAEFFDAVAVLGVGRAELLGYPDGELSDVPVAELAAQVRRLVDQLRPSHLPVFDSGGVTGHADHVQATRAALAAAEQRGLPVLGWALPGQVAARLNAEFGTRFVGRPAGELDQVLTVTGPGSGGRSAAIAASPPTTRCRVVAWSCSATPSNCGCSDRGPTHPRGVGDRERAGSTAGGRSDGVRDDHPAAGAVRADCRAGPRRVEGAGLRRAH